MASGVNRCDEVAGTDLLAVGRGRVKKSLVPKGTYARIPGSGRSSVSVTRAGCYMRFSTVQC